MSEFLSASWWSGVSAIVLFATLVTVVVYTIQTVRLAHFESEKREMDRQPVVTFSCAEHGSFAFRTQVRNLSPIHAKYRVKATITINGTELFLASDHHYAGKRIWELQGSDGLSAFYGHLAMDGLINAQEIPNLQLSTVDATVRIESWAINYFDSEELLFTDEKRNPTLFWYWSCGGRSWVPEVSPQDSSPNTGQNSN